MGAQTQPQTQAQAHAQVQAHAVHKCRYRFITRQRTPLPISTVNIQVMPPLDAAVSACSTPHALLLCADAQSSMSHADAPTCVCFAVLLAAGIWSAI